MIGKNIVTTVGRGRGAEPASFVRLSPSFFWVILTCVFMSQLASRWPLVVTQYILDSSDKYYRPSHDADNQYLSLDFPEFKTFFMGPVSSRPWIIEANPHNPDRSVYATEHKYCFDKTHDFPICYCECAVPTTCVKHVHQFWGRSASQIRDSRA